MMRVSSSAVVLAGFAVVSATAGFGQTGFPELTVAPGDILSVAVLSRPELSGDFIIRLDGTISVHFLDDLAVAGLTPSEIDRRIEKVLEEQTSLPASTTVQVLGWRPIYVAGDVASPGSHDYRLGLTVAQAMSLAGGPFPRIGEAQGSSLDLRIASERAEITRRKMLLADLHARRIRLEAQAAGLSELQADDALREFAGDLTDSLIADQAVILLSQATEDSVEMHSAEEKAELADVEASALREQQRILRDQVDNSQTTLTRFEDLLERGLTNTNAVRELRRTLNYENIQLMQATSFEARARQSKADALAGRKLQEHRRKTAISNGLYETRVAIQTTLAAIQASNSLIQQILPLASSSSMDTEMLAPPYFRIRRQNGVGATEVFMADLDTFLFPGDVVEIRRGGWLDSGEAD